MPEPAYDSVRFFKQEIDKPAAESKKYKLIQWGMIGTLGIFIVTALLTFVKPDVGVSLTGLAQIVVGAYAGLVAVGCGSIAAVDFRNSQSLQNTIRTVTEAKTEEKKIEVESRKRPRDIDDGTI